MKIQDILDYIDRSPYSINKTVLKGMIESLDVDGSGAVDVPEVPAIEMDELVVKKNGVFKVMRKGARRLIAIWYFSPGVSANLNCKLLRAHTMNS